MNGFETMEMEQGNNLIAPAGVGVDNINIPAATKQGIVVVNSPQGNTTSAAEHTWAMILAMARQIPQAHNKLKQGCVGANKRQKNTATLQ